MRNPDLAVRILQELRKLQPTALEDIFTREIDNR